MARAFSGKCLPSGTDPGVDTGCPQKMPLTNEASARFRFNLSERRSGRFRHGMLALKIVVALGAVAAAGLFDTRNAAMADWRQAAPWCAYMGGRDGGYDCGYYTFEQCMATARGLGGSCAPNPRVVQDPDRQGRRTRR
jgi:hypothetical protein